MTDLQDFTKACISTLIKTTTGEGVKSAQLSEQARLDLEADCRSFWHRFGWMINADHMENNHTVYSNATLAGRDFWLTRDNLIAAFRYDPSTDFAGWGGYADTLMSAAKGYGKFDIYIGDENLIYHQVK